MTTYLITGGAGSLGTYLIKQIFALDNNATVRVLDNNEHRLSLLKDTRIRKLYGDIADRERVQKAMFEVDIVIHAAALKNIEITEFNTSELIKTNVIGTDNIIKCSVEANVKKVMFISSDKAVEPTTIYGASKLIGEHVALNYNNTNKNTRISVFRSGNFLQSNGNVIEIWKSQIKNDEPLSITDKECQRYFIRTSTVSVVIMSAIDTMKGGEIFIPNTDVMPERKIIHIMKNTLMCLNQRDNYPIKITGLRQGEKIKEQLMTKNESERCTNNTQINCLVIT